MVQSKAVKAPKTQNELANARETFESIWVAIILAFVLRAFVIEAFVIPTGSMAPQLMGQHVLLECPDCGNEFPFGLSFDASVDPRTQQLSGPRATCPNCEKAIGYNQLPLSGDRVLVMKYLYKFRPPQRWDVVVFKNPQSNRDNYIKRLAGLPGEELRIIHGDVFVRPIEDFNGDGVLDERDMETAAGQAVGWRVARKEHHVQDAMWQLVFDNDYRPANRDRQRNPWEELWESQSEGEGSWQREHNGRVFVREGGEAGPLYFGAGRRDVFRPTYGYNDRDYLSLQRSDVNSDLRLSAMLVPKSETGMVSLTLSNLHHQFLGEINFDGRVRLRHRLLGPDGEAAGEWEDWGEASVGALKPGQAMPVALAHADWKVTLWIDGKPVLESDDDVYRPDVDWLVGLVHAVNSEQEEQIPIPVVGFAAAEGAMELWQLQVMRDVFYTNPTLRSSPAAGSYGAGIAAAQHGRPGWGTMDNPITLRAYERQNDLDEFFMLGDNSPQSHDSRLWVDAAASLRLEAGRGYQLGTVPRYNLMGRAFFVYWPAGHRIPGLNVPIVPNVGKMRLIY